MNCVCVFELCREPGRLHLGIGMEPLGAYTGDSWCSVEHLIADMHTDEAQSDLRRRLAVLMNVGPTKEM